MLYVGYFNLFHSGDIVNMEILSLPKSVQRISIHLDANTCDSFLSKLNSNEWPQLQALDISIHREYLSTNQISVLMDWFNKQRKMELAFKMQDQEDRFKPWTLAYNDAVIKGQVSLFEKKLSRSRYVL